jgi:ArsR family transcriptional regulator
MATQPPEPAALFQALSDTTRLRLLRLVHREELNVQELVQILEMRQPRISKHLAVLRDGGWIRQRREGTWSWYRGVPPDAFAGGARLYDEVLRASDRIAEVAHDDAALAVVRAERETRARDVFAKVARDWDRIRREFEHPELQVGILAALVDRRLRVVDVGTGTGALLTLLAAAVNQVVAVDSSEAMLARASQHCRRAGLDNVVFQRADVRALPLRDACADAVYGSLILHHLVRPLEGLAEMARIARPGGQVVVIGFTRHEYVWMRDELAHHQLGFAREEIEELFGAAGLELRHYAVHPGRQSARRRTPEAGGAGSRWPDVFLAVAEKPTASLENRAETRSLASSSGEAGGRNHGGDLQQR